VHLLLADRCSDSRKAGTGDAADALVFGSTVAYAR
jgi:hypothetical protein